MLAGDLLYPSLEYCSGGCAMPNKILYRAENIIVNLSFIGTTTYNTHTHTCRCMHAHAHMHARTHACTHALAHTHNTHTTHTQHTHTCTLGLKQISKISGCAFEIHYPNVDLNPFRIVVKYFKQL